MSKSSCPICDEGLADPKYIIYEGKRREAAGKVCYEADPTQSSVELSGEPFPCMYILRVSPKRGNMMLLMFKRKEDAFKWDKFKAGDWIAFEGCIHAVKSTNSRTKTIGKWKGPYQLRMQIEATTRQVVFDISRITQTESKNIK